MKLKILLPSGVFLEEEVRKVSAEAPNGHFTLLPRHVDFVTALIPGILSFDTDKGDKQFVAVDDGTLVKCGSEVRVACFRAVRDTHLATLRQTVEEQFKIWDEQERKARTASARLEASLVRQWLELEK